MKKAFTLIELLVVIAIIAILAAMLLPALSAARESARSSNCVSQLKQLGLATTLYMDQHNGYTPPGRWKPGVGNWTVTLGEYLYVSENTNFSKKDSKFRCPSISEQPDNVSGSIWASYVPNGSFFYAFSGTESEQVVRTEYKNTSVIGQPDYTAIFIESSWPGEPGYIEGHISPQNNFNQYSRIEVGREGRALVAFPHGQNQNTVFFDGHVDSLPNPGKGKLLNIACKPTYQMYL